MKKFLSGLIGVFLLGNLVIRFGSIFHYPPYNGVIAGFLGVVTAACVYVVFFPRYLKHLLFIFGFSFFLFGFGSIDLQSRIFELIVTLVATALFVMNWRRKVRYQTSEDRGQGSEVRDQAKATSVESAGGKSDSTNEIGGLNRPLVLFILCYVMLSAFSLLLVPVRTIVKDLWYFGFPDGFFYLFIGPPYGVYYPVVAVLRLMLFGVLALALARTGLCRKNYKWLFSGIFAGAVFSTVIGLLDLYGVISLAPYRFGITAGVLQSTFLNRGWFAEFILVAVPFVLIGFTSPVKGRWWKILLFASLVLCEIALILAGARAGWVAYPLILFICWLFFYFSKEGRLETFHFSWRHLAKVGISVPITIVLSFLIVFQLLMPLSDHLRDDTQRHAGAKKYKATGQYLERRVTEFTKTGRIDTWKDSIHVGGEGPWFGRGYEAYYWNAMVLEDIPSSPYMQNRLHEKIRQTPHNTFIQLFVSGGVVGLCLWLVIIGYALTLLIFDVIKNKRLLNIPVIISMISFHMYGIFQSMQYIPMIWLMIFLCLGYAMTVREDVLPGRFRRVMSKGVVGAMVVVGISFFFYLYNFESRNLAQKYGLDVYAMEPDRDRFSGFYQPSKRWKYGDYRWCGERGSILIAERGTRNAEDAPVERPGRGPGSIGQGTRNAEGGTRNAEQQPLELEFYCRTPGVEEEPVVVTVYHEGEVVDKVVFGGEGARRSEDEKVRRSEKRKGKKGKGWTVRRSYKLSETLDETQKLVIEVSRTWVPHEVLGNFDRREMGIGVKILRD